MKLIVCFKRKGFLRIFANEELKIMEMNEENSLHELTQKLFVHAKDEKPSLDFTDKVMARLDTESVSEKGIFLKFIQKTKDSWSYIIPLMFLFGGFIYYIFSRSGEIANNLPEVNTNPYFKSISTLINTLFSQIASSPIIAIGILALVFLLVFDRLIVKYLHSI